MHFYPDEPPPPDMTFPVWEGPVMLTQVFGLCDVSLAMVTSACWIWTTVAFIGLFFGFGIVGFGAYRIHKCIKAGELMWKKSKIKHPTKIRQEYNKIRSKKQKFSACFLIFFAVRFKGDWTKHSEMAKFWSCWAANYTSELWIFFSFKMFGKFFNAFVANVIPGSCSCFPLYPFFLDQTLLGHCISIFARAFSQRGLTLSLPVQVQLEEYFLQFSTSSKVLPVLWERRTRTIIKITSALCAHCSTVLP